jgi:hypothetical protein
LKLSDHQQDPESYSAIPDESLRWPMRQAVDRAACIEQQLFVALYCGTPDEVLCFDARLAPAASEFLCACAKYAFPREVRRRPGPQLGREVYRVFGEIPDEELRAAIQSAYLRALELGYLVFFDLSIGQTGGRLAFWRLSTLELVAPGREADSHLHRCFEMAMIASKGAGELLARQRLVN